MSDDILFYFKTLWMYKKILFVWIKAVICIMFTTIWHYISCWANMKQQYTAAIRQNFTRNKNVISFLFSQQTTLMNLTDQRMVCIMMYKISSLFHTTPTIKIRKTCWQFIHKYNRISFKLLKSVDKTFMKVELKNRQITW